MISVIIPIYRVEKYIEACIRSVIAQTYRDFELILVDDGSPDASAQIAEALLKTDGTVPYRIIHTENRGVSAARNTGLAEATGTYVIMVDSDDVLSPDFLQEFADMTRQQPELDVYSCGFSVVDETSWQTFCHTAAERQSFSWSEAQEVFFTRHLRFLLPTLLLRRSFVEEHRIRFDEAVRYSEDVQFIWRCLAYNRQPVFHSHKQLYNYILHPGSTMTASGVPKILTCFGGLQRLLEEVGDRFCPIVKEQLAMRTHFSILHGAAKMMDRKTFCQLYRQANSTPHIRAQAKTGSLPVRLVATSLLICKPAGYQIMRKL